MRTRPGNCERSFPAAIPPISALAFACAPDASQTQLPRAVFVPHSDPSAPSRPAARKRPRGRQRRAVERRALRRRTAASAPPAARVARSSRGGAWSRLPRASVTCGPERALLGFVEPGGVEPLRQPALPRAERAAAVLEAEREQARAARAARLHDPRARSSNRPSRLARSRARRSARRRARTGSRGTRA